MVTNDGRDERHDHPWYMHGSHIISSNVDLLPMAVPERSNLFHMSRRRALVIKAASSNCCQEYRIIRMARNLIFSTILLLSTKLALGACPPFSGSFFIEQQDLYPEGADWDPDTCTLYLGYVCLKLRQNTTMETDQPR